MSIRRADSRRSARRSPAIDLDTTLKLRRSLDGRWRYAVQRRHERPGPDDGRPGARCPLSRCCSCWSWRGEPSLRPSLFTELPPAAGMAGGGIGNALLGTLLMVVIASLISVPLGILAAVFLARVRPGQPDRHGRAVLPPRC